MKARIDSEHLKVLVLLAEACTEGSTEHKEHADAIAAAKKAIAAQTAKTEKWAAVKAELSEEA